MKVAYLAENIGTVPRPWLLSADSLMRQTGLNVGNLAFWYATRLLFDAELHLVGWETKASEVPKDIKALVIPAANFISEGADLSKLAELVSALDRPVFLLGIGAQAESEQHPPKVQPSVVQFLEEVSRRTPTIGVRGEFTAKLCESYGIRNASVLGCPSILINPRLDLGRQLEQRIADLSDGPLAVHAACVKDNIKTVERELVRMTRLRAGASYIVQRPVEFIKVAQSETLTEAEEKYLSLSAAFMGFGRNTEAFRDFLRAAVYVPDAVDSWLQYLRRFSVSVNTRIHGTVMSLTAGVPALCVCHDTRTRELSRQLRVPNIDVRQFVENRYSVHDLFAQAGFSGTDFDEERGRVARVYYEVLAQIGLKPSRHLRSLAGI